MPRGHAGACFRGEAYGGQYQAKPAPPTAPTATSPTDVQRYLGPNQEFNPDYAAAVLSNFVRASLETGVDGVEVAAQLDDLERRVSHH